MTSDLEYRKRTKTTSTVRKKVMVRPEAIFELGIHHVSRVFRSRGMRVHNVWEGHALLHHYRQCVVQFDMHMRCNVIVDDNSMSRYLTQLRRDADSVTSLLQEVHVTSNDDFDVFCDTRYSRWKIISNENTNLSKLLCEKLVPS